MARRGRKPNPVVLKSEGQRQLCERSETLEALGQRLGIAKQTLARIRSGIKKPGSKLRQRFRAEFGIDPRAWDHAPGTDLRTRPPDPTISETAAQAPDERRDDEPSPEKDRAPAAAPIIGGPPVLPPPTEPEPDYVPPEIAFESPGAAKANLIAQLHRIRHARQKAEAVGVDAATLIKWEDKETKLNQELAKLSGELTSADESKLAKTNRFREHVESIRRALKPFPEALEAVAKALDAAR
jgi:transcriptional regulator with XRE-family HTH domain